MQTPLTPFQGGSAGAPVAPPSGAVGAVGAGETGNTAGATLVDTGSGSRKPGAEAEAGDAGGIVASDAGVVEVCDIIPNAGSLTDGDANIDLSAELQRIAGFGGMDGGFYAELTPAQVDTAFGNGPGQMGLSIIRIRVPEAQNNFGRSLAAASRAFQLGATVMATPWTPPANMKSNNSTTGGVLNVAS